MALEIRHYRQDDVNTVWKLHNLDFEGTGAHLGNGPGDENLKRTGVVCLEGEGDSVAGVLDGRILAMGRLRGTALDAPDFRGDWVGGLRSQNE